VAEWIRLAPVDDIPVGQARVYEVDDYRLAVCHVDPATCEADGQTIRVIDDVCTHDGGPLGEGQLSGCRIECPRHGAFFDVRSGKALTFPAVYPVETYPSRVVDGWVEVQL
jgi:3-phenylpropionate/trans-cinnamate dioxygenase ferredoxin subunit